MQFYSTNILVFLLLRTQLELIHYMIEVGLHIDLCIYLSSAILGFTWQKRDPALSDSAWPLWKNQILASMAFVSLTNTVRPTYFVCLFIYYCLFIIVVYWIIGEAYCEAALVYDGLEVRAGQSLGDCYQGFDKYSVSGLPMPLPDKPLIVLMSDTHVTLTWKPALPLGPNLAPYYVVEMAEYPDGDWNEVLKRAGDIKNFLSPVFWFLRFNTIFEILMPQRIFDTLLFILSQ